MIVCQRRVYRCDKKNKKGLTRVETCVLWFASGGGSCRFKDWLLSKPMDTFVIGPKGIGNRNAFGAEEKVY